MEYRISIEVVLCALIGLYAFRFARVHPHWLLTALMSSAILTSGLMQGPGVALLDEVLLLALTLGAITSPTMRAIGSPLRQAGPIWPAALLFYLLVHGYYGAVSFGDWRLIRWPLLYTALLVAWYAHALHAREADKGMSAHFLAWVAAAYFSAYLLHWFVLEVVVHIRWEVMQAVTWSGSTYALFPSLVALPLVLTLLKSHEWPTRRLAYSLLALVSLGTQFYSSRAALIVLLLLVIIASVHLPWRRAVKVALLVLVTQVVALFIANFTHLGPGYSSIGSRVWAAAGATFVGLPAYGGMVVESVGMPYAPRVSDVDRHAHMICAVDALHRADFANLLLGYGQDRHKSVLMGCPALHPYIGQGLTTTRSTAFAAFVINYGLIGMALLSLTVVISIRQLIRNSLLPWITTLPFYVLALVWSLLTDFRDNALVYLVLVFNVFSVITPALDPLSKRAGAAPGKQDSKDAASGGQRVLGI